jgi:hypothetical protein
MKAAVPRRSLKEASVTAKQLWDRIASAMASESVSYEMNSMAHFIVEGRDAILSLRELVGESTGGGSWCPVFARKM